MVEWSDKGENTSRRVPTLSKCLLNSSLSFKAFCDLAAEEEVSLSLKIVWLMFVKKMFISYITALFCSKEIESDGIGYIDRRQCLSSSCGCYR